MDLLLLGAAAIVLVALTVWLVWRPAEAPQRDVRAEEANDEMLPQGDQFEDQYTSATADLSAGGVAVAGAHEEATAEASEFQRASEPWSQPSLAREGVATDAPNASASTAAAERLTPAERMPAAERLTRTESERAAERLTPAEHMPAANASNANASTPAAERLTPAEGMSGAVRTPAAASMPGSERHAAAAERLPGRASAPMLPEPSLATRLAQPKTVSLGAAALFTLGGAIGGAWLYARWQKERNKPVNRLRRRFR